MKHIIIGTAGHIDHGKTTLIKALTGRDTDTLKEEKERGISINLGFTFFDLPSGRRAGIIDVPGHEKFIKNMLAGVSGIDVVLLVIAADEGIMPQTREHFEILQLLNVKKGIIVLTKCDLVDEEWIAMVKDEIREEFNGTFMEKASTFEVSSKTGEGMDKLIEAIDNITEEVESKDIEGHFRLPVDRVFSISGFGTVVTGTIIGGRVKEGDSVEIYPSKQITKVRSIQVHEQTVAFAEAGQRCALNLANVKVSDLKRGDVISKEEVMEPSLMVDCSLYYLKSAAKELENRQRLRLYHGTNEILCRAVLIDKEVVKPGENAFVQLRLEEPITAQRGDRFVLRSYSPMFTIGGGVIINPMPEKAKRFNMGLIEELKLKESGSAENIIETTVNKISHEYPGEFEILKALGKNEENIAGKLEELLKDKKIVKLDSQEKTVYLHKNYIKEKTELLEGMLLKFHKENPLKIGVSKEEIRSKVFGKNIKQKIYDLLLIMLEERNIIAIHNNFISLYGYNVELSEDMQSIADKILDEYNKGGYMPPKYEELAQHEKDKKKFRMVYDYLIDSSKLVKVSEECVLNIQDYEKAKQLVRSYIIDNGSLTAAQGRDLLDTSRKYAVAVLEHFDALKLTKRIDDKRVLY